jgi:cytochrome oxidase Cu insertion factor (SCO1/SenC/PrrC family)
MSEVPSIPAGQPPPAASAGPARPVRNALGLLVRMKWAVWGAALAAGISAGVTIAILDHNQTVVNAAALPVVTWAANTRPAPNFTLTDQNGKPVTLAALRGRPVIVTFIDPLCRNFCPREASIISQAAMTLAPDHPAVVAVSVDRWGDTQQSFRADAAHWRLVPDWQWGAGTQARLAAVWRKYEIGVSVTKKRIDGITLREITHTAATYLIDPSGHERALLLYPFTAGEIAHDMQTMLATTT